MVGSRETMGSDVPQGIMSRIASGLRYVVSGAGPEAWFGPMNPLMPIAQDKAAGRQFDYPVGYNLRIQPRDGEPVSFQTLRALADGYDLMRLVIETRKDQVEAFDWEIVPKVTSSGQYTGNEDGVQEATEFLQRPDKEHTWHQWLRMQVEDLLVIDAIAVYPRMDRGGKLYSLELIDAATLKRVIGADGRTPIPPDPAYQQVLHGIPAVDYTSQDIIYSMRNPRTNRIYGLSPTEQIMMTANIALRRQMSQLDFYTSGNVPEAIAQVPDTWTPSQISEFQLRWDSVMEGGLAARRKMRFIPSLKDIVFPKLGSMKDEWDEWLARLICFAFSVTPSSLIKQVNRASAEQIADSAEREGLLPLMRFLEAHVTSLLQVYMGFPNLVFRFKTSSKTSEIDRAQIHQTYIACGVITPDEAREQLGLPALTPDERLSAFPNPAAPTVGGTTLPAPILPFGSEPDISPQVSNAEKMLSRTIEMLDPRELARVASALRPNIVEVKPDVLVEVGDTVVNIPASKQ